MELKPLTLTKVIRKNRVSARTGKSFVSLGLKCQEYGEKWLSGFGSKDNDSWKEGDVVEVAVEQKGQYLNFTTPAKPRVTNSANEDVIRKLTALSFDVGETKLMVSEVLDLLKGKK